MKIILILLLLPLSLFSQTKGKIVRNQSIKATSVWIDTLSFKMWLVEIKNMNNCISDIEIVKGEDNEDTTVFEVEPFEAVKILASDTFHLRFRNATSCAGGNMEWLQIDSYLRAEGLIIGNIVTLGTKSVSCEEVNYYPITLPDHWNDSVATRMRQEGMQSSRYSPY